MESGTTRSGCTTVGGDALHSDGVSRVSEGGMKLDNGQKRDHKVTVDTTWSVGGLVERQEGRRSKTKNVCVVAPQQA